MTSPTSRATSPDELCVIATLYADNLVVDDDGTLLGILDWDMAETWDAAGEWFKLDLAAFAASADGRAPSTTHTDAIHPHSAVWQRRKYLVDLMETLNAVANARVQGWTRAFKVRARSHLESLLASPPLVGGLMADDFVVGYL